MSVLGLACLGKPLTSITAPRCHDSVVGNFWSRQAVTGLGFLGGGVASSTRCLNASPFGGIRDADDNEKPIIP